MDTTAPTVSSVSPADATAPRGEGCNGNALEQDYIWTFSTANDTTAPSTTHTLSPQPNAAGWDDSNVTVTLSATDTGGSGIKEIRYSATGAQSITEATYDEQNPPVINTESTTTISYFATDKAGNQETPAKTLIVKLDKTAPILDTDSTEGTDGITPDNGAAEVSRNTKPTATFSDLMDRASLSTSAKLYQWNALEKVWQKVPAKVSVKGKTATQATSEPQSLRESSRRPCLRCQSARDSSGYSGKCFSLGPEGISHQGAA